MTASTREPNPSRPAAHGRPADLRAFAIAYWIPRALIALGAIALYVLAWRL